MYVCLLNVVHSGECETAENMGKKVVTISIMSGNNSQSEEEFLGRQWGSVATVASSCRRKGNVEISSAPSRTLTSRRCSYNYNNNNNNSESANEELVQPPPGCKVVQSPEEAFPTSAGLNNLLKQLATKHKQKCRTERRRRLCPGGVESSEEGEEKENEDFSGAGEAREVKKCDRLGGSADAKWCCSGKRSSLVAEAVAGSVVLRPAKLAWLAMISLLLFSILVVPVAVVQGDEIKAGQVGPPRKGGVCGSVDVRNSPTHLDRLKDCVVVEGFVHILLIDKYKDEDFQNYTFPLLTEITEYLLLFRINGLKTLRRLFPNLAVIRGDVLVGDYAMVVYELMHIEEIGLFSLVDITRGGVRIEKNPKLCFTNSIDWNAITMKGSNNYIKVIVTAIAKAPPPNPIMVRRAISTAAVFTKC